MINDGIKTLFERIAGQSAPTANQGITIDAEKPTIEETVTAYNTMRLAQKVVDVPIADMLREGIEWEGEAEVIERISSAYDQFDILKKLQDAKRNQDVYGAGILFLSDSTDLEGVSEQLTFGQDGLTAINVLPSHRVKREKPDSDITSDAYGRSEFYIYKDDLNKEHRIHSSRIIVLESFCELGSSLSHTTDLNKRWGSSRLATILPYIKQYEAASRNLSEMFHKAIIDAVSIEGLDKKIIAGKEDEVTKRWSLVRLLQSVANLTLIDSKDEIKRHAMSFGGLPGAIHALLLNVAGASDIPATKLIGMSPAGLSATGESDIRNYFDSLSGVRERDITPAINSVNEALFIHVFGSDSVKLDWSYPPLWQPTEKEIAETEKAKSEVFKNYYTSGAMPDEIGEAFVKEVMLSSDHGQAMKSVYEEYESSVDVSGIGNLPVEEDEDEDDEEEAEETEE